MKENGKVYAANDFTKEKLIKDESKYDLSSSSDTDTLGEEIPSVSFITLFHFASTMDKLYIFLAIIFSIIRGVTTPINTLLFSSFLQSMVNYGKSNAENNSQPEVFLHDVRDFVIYSSVVGAGFIILSYAATILMNISAFNQVYRIRQEFLKSILNQDFPYFDTHQTGEFASKMADDIVKLENGIGEKLATFVYYQTSFISSIVMALVKGMQFALLCLILFPVPLFLMGIISRVALRLSKKEAIALEKAGSLAEEVISAIHTVYACCGKQKKIKRNENYLTESREINIKKGFFNGLARGTLFFCIFAAYSLSFWFGYKLMVEEPETYDVETMIAVLFGIIMGSYHFGISLTFLEVFGNARESGAQIYNLINNIPIIDPLFNIGITPDTIDGSIELKSVVFQYPSRPGVTVLKGINVSVQRGQSVALVDHLECGKSTIIQLISRYYEVVGGSESTNGTDDPEISFFQVVKLYTPEWKSITAASICSFISGFATPLLAVILGDLIGILSNPYRYVVNVQVLRYSLMIFGVGIFSGITNFVMVYMYGVARECLTARLKKQLFEKMLQHEVGFNNDENNSTRSLYVRLSRDTAAVHGATRIGIVLQAVGTFSFALGVSLYYESRLGLVALAFIPFMAAVLYKQDRMVTDESFGTTKTMESWSKIAVEAVTNVHTVAALGCQQSLINDYSTQLLSALRVAKLRSHWRGIVFGLSSGLFNFMFAATLYYGAILMVYDRVGYDIILSSAQVLLIGSSSAAKVFSFAPYLQKEFKAAKRVISVLDRNTKTIDPVKPEVENFVDQEALDAAKAGRFI